MGLDKKKRGEEGKKQKYIQAIVVFILPTLVSRDIFANSTAKAGVSSILSLMTFEHLAEL